jgi:NAD(P)-dependent dehydrogenase (short-subunit alcohol dehydrogenase family)
MLLQNKTAIIYGAAGAIGQTVARTFAHEGARVFITGRNKNTIQALAKKINTSGGFAEAQVVDALDEKAVNDHLQSVIQKEGKIDISFNAIGIKQTGVQGIPLIELSPEAYLQPIVNYSRSHFITATAAARYMIENKSGIIFTLTSVPSKLPLTLMGGMSPMWAGLEALTRTLAGEVGAHGVRVVNLRVHGMPETDTITEVFGLHAKGEGMGSHKDYQQVAEQFTLLHRLPKLSELAETAAFIASDKATAITGTSINISGGAVVD